MKICKNCGKEILKSIVICPICGKISDIEASEKEKPVKGKRGK